MNERNYTCITTSKERVARSFQRRAEIKKTTLAEYKKMRKDGMTAKEAITLLAGRDFAKLDTIRRRISAGQIKKVCSQCYCDFKNYNESQSGFCKKCLSIYQRMRRKIVKPPSKYLSKKQLFSRLREVFGNISNYECLRLIESTRVNPRLGKHPCNRYRINTDYWNI